MTHNQDEVKTFPLPDSHLHGAAVLASSLLEHQAATCDCREQVEILRMAVSELWSVVHNVADLFMQYELALQMAAAAKEHPVFKLPAWFFQAESDNARAMLIRRAKYLSGCKLNVDAAWDNLKEFCESCHLTISDDDLAVIIEAAYGGKGGR